MGTPTELTTSAAPASRPPHTVTVRVNNQPVVLPDREVTGLEVKQAAITQGLPIDLGFQLSVRHGHRYEIVADNEPIRVHPNEDFLAVPPDDNS
ncbi:multiubiquitin domain-containing protein [Streptomyces sp. JNUCC 63]